MVAKARWRWRELARGMLMLLLMSSAAAASMSGLPDGLPQLPRAGARFLGDLRSGIALRGFDPVAYHVSGQAVPGRADCEVIWNGATWRFALEANRAAFLADPERFAPRFEGLDAMGVSQRRPVDADPTHFAVIEGALLLFRSAANREAFLAGRQAIQEAEAAWPDVARQLTR